MRQLKNLSFKNVIIFCAMLFSSIFCVKAKANIDGLNLIVKKDCGSGQSDPYLVEGASYKYSGAEVPFDSVAADSPDRTVVFGSRVVYAFKGLDTDAEYKVRVRCLSDSAGRVQSFFADDIPLKENAALPDDSPMELVFDLPGKSYSDGEVQLWAENKAGPNAVVSVIELWSSAKDLLPAVLLSARGDLKGNIVGLVTNLNNDNKPVTGAEINIETESGTVETTTDDEGCFSLRLPVGNVSERIKVSAITGKVSDFMFVPAESVSMPRLSPAPLSVEGVNKPRLDLTGTWKFNPVPEKDFYRGIQTDNWFDIQVPGEWVMQGFEVPKNKAAGYMREFFVPADWKDMRIKLRCDSVYSETQIWVNGSSVGSHKTGLTPFEFDITDCIDAGENNRIAMAVKNESLADTLASGSQYAVHQLGGINRKIYLFAVPTLNIASMHVETVFDDEYKNATIRIPLQICNEGDKSIKGAKATFDLIDCADKSYVKLSDNTFDLPSIEPGQILNHTIELAVGSPKKWDCEHPNLYLVECDLEKGLSTLQTVQRRFGFRQIEVRGNQVFVNNMPIKLHGVNRHEAHPLRGRSLTPAQWRADAELFRAANCNYIRTSHYPPAEEFIDACDELGLFVEQEAPLCWVGHHANQTWQKENPHSVDLQATIFRGTLEMIQRDRSHPSVIIWSLANESAWGPNFKNSFELSNIADPTRPKSFHDQSWGGFNNFGSNTQIANIHYPGPNGPERGAESERPLLFGEYCHLNAYNRYELTADPGLRDMWGRGFEKMWEKMYRTQAVLGGALWSGIDDTFFLPNGKTVGYGTWGPIDGWRRQKPEYWHTKKIYSPVKVLTEVIEQPGDGQPVTIKVENRHDFTNINELTVIWLLGKATGIVKADIPPRSTGDIIIPVKSKSDAKLLTISFYSSRGFIDKYELPVGESVIPVYESKPLIAGELDDTKNEKEITVKGTEFSYVFDAVTGMITRAEVGGRGVLTGGPTLMILPLNNGGDTQMTGNDEYAPSTETCTNWQASDIAVTENEKTVQIRISGKYDQAEGTYVIDISNIGRMSVVYDFRCTKDINPRQIGIVLDISAECDLLKWHRKGQWTVYPDDHIARITGSAKAFVGTLISASAGCRVEPAVPWSLDCNALGTNDFRSTKTNIYWASLTDADGRGVVVCSNGSQSTRSWMDKDRVRLLISQYDNAGAERFFRSHAAVDDKPLKTGDVVKDTVFIDLLKE